MTTNNETHTEFVPLDEKIDTLTAMVGELLERQRAQQEFIDEMSPIAGEVMAWATGRLDVLEREGWFDMGREALSLLDGLVAAYRPEDVRQLGDSMVTILDTVRAVTQPEVMALVSEAGEALQHGGELEPKSPWEVLQAGKDPDVQRGIAVMVEVLKQVGRTSAQLRPVDAEASKERHRRILNKRTAPSRGRYTPSAPRAAPARRAGPPTPRYGSPAVDVVQAPVQPPVAPKEVCEIVIEGWVLNDEGFLLEPAEWTEDFAHEMAGIVGVPELTEHHWVVIRYARQCWTETGSCPNIRKITQGSGVSTKVLYSLWPSAPGKTTARVAGLHKPVGCI